MREVRSGEIPLQAMGVKLKGDINNFLTIFEQAEEIMADEIRTGLARLGEECVANARKDGKWKDQTSNLRSSIGYAVMDHGADVISSAFNAVGGSSGTGEQGAAIGGRYVKELAKQYAEVFALVVVAGMEYAPYLEAKGIDVLSGQQLWAEQHVEEYLKVYKGRAERRIAALFRKL